MARDPHSHDLRHSCPAHVADCCPAQVMEFERRHFGRLTGFLPGAPKLLEGDSVMMEHPLAPIRILPRPPEPGLHIAFEDRDDSGVPTLGPLRFQRYVTLLPIHLPPLDREQLA